MPGRSTVVGAGDPKERFTGYELDGETGLMYAAARHYDPVVGRFLSIDRYADKYPSLAPFQYASNNPLAKIDLNGDSVVVIFRRIQDMEGVRVHHAALVWYDE